MKNNNNGLISNQGSARKARKIVTFIFAMMLLGSAFTLDIDENTVYAPGVDDVKETSSPSDENYDSETTFESESEIYESFEQGK